MRLTRSRHPAVFEEGVPANADDEPRAPEAAAELPAPRGEGETLLPGQSGRDLVDELRREVEAVETLKAATRALPDPRVEAGTPAPPAAPEAAVPPGLLESILPVVDDPAPVTPPADPVRFGPTTFAPPPAPIEFPPIADFADVDESPDPFAEPGAAPKPEPTPEIAPAGAMGEVKIKKSSARKRGAKRDKTNKVEKLEKAAAAPPAPTAEPAAPASKAKAARRPFSKKSPAPAAPAAKAAPKAAPERSIFDTSRPAEEAAKPAIAVDEESGPRHSGRPLGEILVGRGLVSEDQLRDALTTQTGSGKRLGNILVELGLLSERGLSDVLAEQLQVEFVELARIELDREIVTLLPEDVARRLHAVPIARDGDRIDVAVADPLGEHLQEQLIEKLNAPVRIRLSTQTDIDAVINNMYAPAADLGDALRMFEARLEQRKSTKDTEQTTATVVDENAPVVKVVNLILDTAVRARASDVHIEPMPEAVRIRVRTDGALHEAMTLPAAMGASLVSRIKVMSDMNIVEKRKPQDGQLAVTIAGRDLDVRVSTTPTVFGEKCVLRVLDKPKRSLSCPPSV